MAILEVNLEKPALIEEYQFPAESSDKSVKADAETESTSGSSKGKFVGLLAVVVGIGLLVRRLKNRGSEQNESKEYEQSPEPDIGADESSGSKRKVAGLLGLALTLVSLVVAIRKRRS